MPAGRYINVDESLKEDIGDFKAFKQSNRSLHFRENGTGIGVDSLWLELQNDFGKGLFPDSVSNPSDQIWHIADTLNSLTESDMQNPYAADMELTVEQMAYDVMARAAGPNRQKATKADQAVERTTQELNRLLKAGRTRSGRGSSRASRPPTGSRSKTSARNFSGCCGPARERPSTRRPIWWGRCGTSANSSTIPKCGGRPGGS